MISGSTGDDALISGRADDEVFRGEDVDYITDGVGLDYFVGANGDDFTLMFDEPAARSGAWFGDLNEYYGDFDPNGSIRKTIRMLTKRSAPLCR
ncbi:MAG: hypothetical protein AAGM38_00440 [Pseudomonadota bacterium]